MGKHEQYGKQVLRAAALQSLMNGATVRIDHGAGDPAVIDATVGNIAVQIEARTPKQVRGAIPDLICRPRPKNCSCFCPSTQPLQKLQLRSVRTSLGVLPPGLLPSRVPER